MRDLVIMPAMAQRRESLNMGEFAEEAIIVEEVAAPKRVNHFIEANTQEVTLQHLQQDCIIPSFASMEETISHQSFIGAVVDAAKDYFHGEPLSRFKSCQPVMLSPVLLKFTSETNALQAALI